MTKITTLAELDKLKAEMQAGLQKIRQENLIISIGTGTCGLAAGAGDTLRQVEIELEKRSIAALINTVGCIGNCVREPIMDVQLPGKERVSYRNVRPEMVGKIIDEHVLGGSPVMDWVIGSVPLEW